MSGHPTIDETIIFAAQAHAGQRDKAGVPYIAHPLAVMRRVPAEAWRVAVLHDAIEDCAATGVTLADLRDRGYGDEEIAAVEILTRRESERYHDYIERIATSGNELAIVVKIADLEDNMDLSRIGDEVSAEDVARADKYDRARARLTRDW